MKPKTQAFIHRLNKRSDFKLSEYKIIGAQSVYDEERAYYGYATQSLNDNFVFDIDNISSLKNSMNIELTPQMASDYTEAHRKLTTQVLSTLRARTKMLKINTAEMENQMMTCAAELIFNTKSTYDIIKSVEHANPVQLATDMSNVMLSPFITLINMRNSINIELMERLSLFSDAIFNMVMPLGVLNDPEKAKILETEFNKYPFHVPFDKCIYIFGEFAVRYTKTSLDRSEFVIMMDTPGGVSDILFARFELDAEGTIIGPAKNETPVMNLYHVHTNTTFLHDIHDMYILWKLSTVPVFKAAIDSMGINIDAIREHGNYAFQPMENANIELEPTLDNMKKYPTIWQSLVSAYCSCVIESFVVTSLLLTSRNIRVNTIPLFVENQKRNKKKGSSGSPVLRVEYSTINVSVDTVGIHEVADEYNINDDHESRSVTKHIRRGHFKLYTKDRPLFGKYAGLVWVPETVVGNKGTNIKKSDYDVSV